VIVKGLQLRQRHSLDIAADAAFTERKRHPRFEMGEDQRFRLGMIGEPCVEPVGPCLHQLAQPERALRIVRLEPVGVDEQALAQILPDRAFPFRFGQAAQIDQVIAFDPGKSSSA
jgi:hypothetical protein